MPSFTPHLLIPLGLLLALRIVPPRVALAMLPFTLVPDLDYFIPPHRAFTGSIWWPLLASLAAWRLHAHGHGRWLHAAVAAYYLWSHMLMDAFAGGVVPLWPFLDWTVFIDAAIVVDTATNTPTLVADAGAAKGIPQVTSRYVWFSPIDAAMWAMTAVTVAAWWLAGRPSLGPTPHQGPKADPAARRDDAP